MEFTKVIKATGNQQIKDLKKLHTTKGRKKAGRYLLEGWHLVKEALASQADITTILVTADFKHLAELEGLSGIDLIEISPEVAQSLSDAKSAQGIFAVLSLAKTAPVEPKTARGAWLLLDGIQDPGNIGTMVRTADAAGFSGVVFGTGSADLYQPKVLRAMQGSQFHIKLAQGELLPWIEAFQAKHYPVFGSELNEAARPYNQVGKHQDFALIMGNEGNGMQRQHLELTDLNLYIPIKGQAESLNVAVAAGILMFELLA
ncbi:TrmH family RNA methyltransferase [Ligilactobacillus agilis]|uniref:TrmH family RNA methyltransferase n=1 Tax=Ligilactobacillus agilis TaxID=1601 RepID=UPI000B8D9181|nr:RNA methyltransferase [Ligilactobacillus agilis]ASR40512.1 RNA methyltransferase [Ligilactobacillus agilis]MDY4064353.1 RNA methyltransferase [Ligilactobacillus agilis]GET18473.1 rRNA methyltransferase [Ligilactobacillus agilis]